MIQTPPSETFEATTVFASGLAGTLGVRIRDNQGNDFLARTTTGIAADTTVGTTTVYRRTFTAPTTTGQYTVIWDDGTDTIQTEELVVTYSVATALTGSVYVTPDELKGALTLTGRDYADDDIDMACNAASRAIDRACSMGDNGPRRFFYTSADVRYYTPEQCATAIEIDDLTTLTTLEVDLGGSGTYTEWTEGTDFWLDPANALEDGRPYERVQLRTQARTYWPGYRRSVKITGTFGWSAVPSEVRQYAKILAGKLLMRSRSAPFGIITVAGDTGAIARIARVDPDFDTLIGHLARMRPFA